MKSEKNILIAFILGFPANEIVVPVIMMAYTSGGVLTESSGIMQMKEIFLANGWNMVTAINMIIFTLFHWPCSTTLLTVKKETGSLKWTALAFLLPTVTGTALCIIVNLVANIIM